MHETQKILINYVFDSLANQSTHISAQFIAYKGIKMNVEIFWVAVAIEITQIH